MAEFDPDAFLAEARAADVRRQAAPAASPVAPAASPSGPGLLPAKPSDRKATTGEIGRAASAAAEYSFDPDEFLATGGAEDVDEAEAFGRGAIQGVTLGFSDELAGLVEMGFTKKTYAQARDESRELNRQAQRQHGGFYTAGEIAGGVAVPGIGAGGLAAKAGLRGVGAIAATGAIEGAVQGIGESEGGTNDAIRRALLGGLTGGIVAGGAGKAFGRYVDDAERRAVRNTTQELTEGAVATQQRRYAEIKDLAFQEVTPDREFMKVVNQPEKAREVAKARAAKFGAETEPIYTKLDVSAGKFAVREVVQGLDEQISRAAQDFGDDGTDLVLAEVRDRFVAKARAKYGDAVEAVPHKEVRRWVTGLLEHKTRVMGSISETENAAFAHEAFKVADNILKTHLDDVRKARPELAPDLEKLSELNRKIRAWAPTEQLMKHKEGREFWKRESGKFISGVSSVAGIAGMAATGSTTGAAFALLPPTLRAIYKGDSKLKRSATAALARLEIAARNGNANKRLILETVRAGVPLALAQSVVTAARAGERMFAAEDDE